MKKQIAALFLVVLFVAACTGTKSGMSSTAKAKETPKEMPKPTPSVSDVKTEIEKVATAEPVKGEVAEVPIPDTLPLYRATVTMENDIIHTKLDVKFDWKKQQLNGKAWITAKPYFYPTSTVTFDAKNFDILKVTMEGSSQALKYDYKNDRLTINLGKTYTRADKYTVYIEYTAKPNEGSQGGSAAITSDKGLFFINADESDPNKPRQVWTQGETESNSRWFPTFDKPNERMTSEIYMTVENKFKTLSNGLLKDIKANSDGTRTDHWYMDLPHAPYLVMMAAGDFAIVSERWRGKEIQYYVEPKYEKYAKAIYKNVPEILEFYSTRLGVVYPWQKLAHIVVRDYVSGAMENTTAIIYGEFMNGTERELIDKDQNESVVAHEMFHHWFGDLVTAESWSNLTVNESFADFSEGLWFEHKYGQDAGDAHRREVMDGYFGEAENKKRNLVDFKYNSREDMFDAHSYNKGGSILHMLRNYMGDDAFFEGTKKYLTDNAYKTGEAHQLRLAMEEVCGQDLNWFFNQWYFASGHPFLDVKYEYDEAAKKMNVIVTQNQDPKGGVPAIFDLPLAIDIYDAAGKAPRREKVRMVKRTQTFSFDAATKPALVDFDGDRMLLAQKTDNHSEEEYMFMLANSSRYLARMEALEFLRESENPKAQASIKKAVNDKYWEIRQEAIKALKLKDDPSVLDKIAPLAESDPRSSVRSTVLSKLAASKDAKWAATYRSVLAKEKAYPVIGSAMQALYKVDAPAAMEMAKKYENDENADLVNSVGSIYAENPKPEHIDFFERSLTKVDGMSGIGFYGSYIKALEKTGATDADFAAKMNKVRDIGVNQSQSPWRRFAAAKAINDLRKKYKGKSGTMYADLSKMLNEIIAKESNDQLKAIFSQMMVP
jgi:aminopeptidase N